MIVNKKYTLLSDAILCSLGLMVFSFFIHYELPVRLISFAVLVMPAYIIGKNLKSLSDLKKLTGESGINRIVLIYCFFGLFLGTLLAILYRWDLEISIFPKYLNGFVIVAALIGCTEEIVFRGFIQDYVKSINAPFSILFSTISHTGYKCCLFLSPVAAADINIGFLALWTFIAGILFGTIKHFSKSILPPLIAHGLFDILVYAEFVSAPWWVW